MEAVGIEQPAAHPIRAILERFRGQVSTRTLPKNTSKTRYRTRERWWIELLWLAPLEDHPPKRTADLSSVETEE